MELGMNMVSLQCALQVTNEEQSSVLLVTVLSKRKPLREVSQNHDPSKSYLQAHGTVHADHTEGLKHVGRLEGWTEKKGLADLSHPIFQPTPTQVDPILNTIYLKRLLG